MSLYPQEVQRRGCRIACVGIPKTIDNDVAYVCPNRLP
jgi:6-phosphofructokinase